MRFKFDFRPRRRRFKPPLQTNHGIWEVRDSIIVRLSKEELALQPLQDTFENSNQSGVGYGEISPISWFGSETIEQALDFCRQLPYQITQETILSIPDRLPACQFGFESASEAAINEITSTSLDVLSITYSALLPAGSAALQAWQKLWHQGYRTFKWKIGVYPIAEELHIFDLLTQALPSAKLRLDANGGLNYDEANLWLYTCDNVTNDKFLVEIEFIEQPLSVEAFDQMQELSYFYNTAIALDESVATLRQIEACYDQGWRGIFVIKPCIAGSPSRLRQFCQTHSIDAVFSSAFESIVGRQAALKLAVELSNNNRAVGFGVNHWFDRDE